MASLEPTASHSSASIHPDDPRARHLSALSHDLRGQLNGLLLNIEVLKRDLAPRPGFDEQVADLDLMRRSVLDTVNYIDRLVFAERFRLGLVTARAGRVDLALMASTLRGHYTLAAQERGATLAVTASGEALADRNLLLLAASNLLANAVAYGRGATVTAHLEGSGERWRLSVTDGGQEVPPRVSAILAEALDATQLVPGIRGGLGLRLVRHAAATLGARIQTRSDAGGFTVELIRD